MRTGTRTTANDIYLELVRAFPLKRLKTISEHAKAKNVVLRLSAGHLDRATRDYLEVLIDLIADYEQRSHQALDTSKISAAELIRHRMEQRGMSITALSREIGMAQSNLSDMLGGRRDWSKAAIRSLSALFNIRAERFLT
jgi:antitoxin component HigA of HigAB toxin-antitoxin module